MGTETLPPKLRKLIEQEMARGGYTSENDVLLKALQALAEQRSAVEGIRRGLGDMHAGRMRTHEEFDRDFRQRNAI